MRGVRLNPGYEHDRSMDILDADHLEWKTLDNGTMIEIESEYYDFVIDLNDILWVYEGDNIKSKRKIVDVDHGCWLAASFEMEAIRQHKIKDEQGA